MVSFNLRRLLLVMLVYCTLASFITTSNTIFILKLLLVLKLLLITAIRAIIIYLFLRFFVLIFMVEMSFVICSW